MIEVKRFVSISDSPFDGDIFDAMAGGASYMETFAGGSMYNPLLLPQTNPKSILQHYAIGRTLEMMGLQEDYVALALMPMQLSDYLSDREVRVMTLVILDGINTYIKAVYGGRGITDSNGNIGSVSSGYGDLAGIAAEMGKDSGFENSLEAAASAAYGPIGGIIAGSLYGAITGTGANIAGNIAEHTIGTLTGVVSRTAVQGITASLGITSTLGIMAATAVIGYALKQVVEVVLGLRSGFGFGGQLVGVDGFDQHTDKFGKIDGVNTSVHPQYEPQMSFTTALADLLGMRTTTDNSMTAEARAQDALNSYYSANPSERGNTGYGSLASMSQQTASESNQRNNNAIADAAGMGDGGDNTSGSGSDGGRGGDGGARHCCTVMVKHRLWRKKRLDDLGEWDKKQDILWRTGYQIGGKIVADFFNKKNRLPYYSKMMDAFYDTHILGKKRTIYTYQAYFFIYPIVYVTGLYAVIKKRFQ